MKLLLVFLAVIAVTFAWRNYAKQQHLWPMPEPQHHPPKFDFNMEATVQSVHLDKNTFKGGQTYIFLGGNNKFLCVKPCLGENCYIIKASDDLPDGACCFIASNIGNEIVAFKSCSTEKYITVDGNYIRPTANVINQAALFTVEVSSPGKWTGTQYVHLKTSDGKYWGVNNDHIFMVTNANVLNTNMTVMEVH